MIEYCNDKGVDLKRLEELFSEAGWTDKTKDSGRLNEMVQNSQVVITAWDNGYMVGFARCTTDFSFNAQINNVVVDARYRGRGIGKELVKRILESNQYVTYILRADASNEGFYGRLGFEPAERTYVFKRKR